MDAEKVVEYWRDQVGLLLGSGAAIVILFAGWAVDHHERFNARKSKWSAEFWAAAGLLAASALYALFLVTSVWCIYDFKLASATAAVVASETLLPKWLAVTIASVLSGVAMIIALLMSFAKCDSVKKPR